MAATIVAAGVLVAVEITVLAGLVILAVATAAAGAGQRGWKPRLTHGVRAASPARRLGPR